MVQIIEQTTEEKMAMYMKLSRKELAMMLIKSQRLNEEFPNTPYYTGNSYPPSFSITGGITATISKVTHTNPTAIIAKP